MNTKKAILPVWKEGMSGTGETGAAVDSEESFSSVTVTREEAATVQQTGETEETQQQELSMDMERDSRGHGEPTSSGYTAYGSITVGVCAMNKKVLSTGSGVDWALFHPRINFQPLYPLV